MKYYKSSSRELLTKMCRNHLIIVAREVGVLNVSDKSKDEIIKRIEAILK